VEFSPETQAVLRLDGVPTDLAWVYRSQPGVRLCVDFLADNIAHCKLKVYHRETGPHGLEHGERREADLSHSLYKLLMNPAPGVSGFDFIRDTIADLAIYGNAHWVIRRAGDAKALVRVMPPYVSARGGSPVSSPDLYIVDVGGGPVDIPVRDMTHFRTYNPSDIRVGTSILEALRGVLSEEKAMSRHRRHYWENAARMEGWIGRPKAAGRWSRAQRREFREDWQAAHSGASTAGKTAILEDDMKLNAYSFSPKDSEFIESREWALDLVATAFHIPLAVLSRKDTATFASMKEFHTMVYVDTLGPWMALMEKAINVQLVPLFRDPSLFVEFNIEEKLQGDFESTAMALRAAGQVPYMSPNDMRRIRNLPRIDEEWADQPARPANYRYAGDPEPVTRLAPTPIQTTEEDLAALDREQAALDAILEEGSGNGHVRV
jgi:HK97 family phage portal protein